MSPVAGITFQEVADYAAQCLADLLGQGSVEMVSMHGEQATAWLGSRLGADDLKRRDIVQSSVRDAVAELHSAIREKCATAMPMTLIMTLPHGVDGGANGSDHSKTVWVRLIRTHDIYSDRFLCRLDVLYAY